MVLIFPDFSTSLCVPDNSLLMPLHLQELYDMYMRELDERKLERAMALEKVTTRYTIKVTDWKLFN